MLAPEFRNVSEVKQFINTSNDAWCLPMVEEYMNMCGVSLKDMERDVAYVEELNGWIQNELKDFTTRKQALEEALEILSNLRLNGVVKLYDEGILLECMDHINKILADLKEEENV